MDARIVKTRAALRAALIDLTATEPFGEITAAAIAHRAGISYATFFRHYADPGALLLDIVDDLIAELGAEIAPLVLAREDVAIAVSLVDFVSTRRHVCTALLVGAGEEMRKAVTSRAMAAARTLGVSPPPDLPTELALVHGVSATLTILAWWLEHGSPSDDIAATILALVFDPLSRR